MYAAIRPFLFRLSAETAHDLTLDGLGALHRLHLSSLFAERVPDHPVEVFGLTFRNQVGLAAGLDKNADYLNALGSLGFGHIEVGTVTPRPQPGNPAPRMFRLPESQAIINRMGFNNKGVDHLVSNLERRTYEGVVGVNIGKNFSTPVEQAIDDYRYCLQAVYDQADYITINLSSPNTPGLRSLQFGEPLQKLLTTLVAERDRKADKTGRRVPLLVKIAPDMTDDEINQIAATFRQCEVDGAIATNTTVERSLVEGQEHASETGGLSGAPVFSTSTHTLSTLVAALDDTMPVIGVGGIADGETAQLKKRAGASLVQLYSGLIYRGPSLIREVQLAIW
ncbi:MAG: quinone-dependent dihydroorotate dehydrogenase [Natronospirillum sp.]